MSAARTDGAPAQLVCERCEEPTTHVFDRLEKRRDERTQAVVGIAHIYRCLECRRLRVWGLDNPTWHHSTGARRAA